MSTTKIEWIGEKTSSMTFKEGLAFIKRTRRQLERLDELPHAAGQTIPPDERAVIGRMCDELEADINRSLSGS